MTPHPLYTRFDEILPVTVERPVTPVCSPLTFKRITLSDLPLINSLLQRGTSRTCDYTVGGLLMWVDYFKYEYCVYKDTLFIKGICENHPGREAFSVPVGEMALEEAVDLLRAYCTEQGMEMGFSAVPEDKIDILEALVPGTVEHLDDWADYLYDINALASLSGKALAKKRNHVNRFMTENPDYVFEPLTPELIPETMLFYAGLRLPSKADVHLAIYEREECIRVLKNYLSYPFEGAVLRGQSGEIVAFTAGEIIGDTLYVHIEKMNHTVAGAGETINKLFAAAMATRYPSLKYVNREEDMGDPGLRYAKQSYRPLMLLHKYNLLG